MVNRFARVTSSVVLKFSSVLSLIALVACSASHNEQFSRYGDVTTAQDIFSTRPVAATDTVLLMKLKTPPLLTSLKTDKDGKKSVDADQAATIQAEQARLLDQVQKIAPSMSVLYRYRLVINGIAAVVPIAALPKISQIADIAYIEEQGDFSRPAEDAVVEDPIQAMKERNSVKFIGGEDAHAAGFTGKGLRLGIIDTGIDYTHAMFGGAGTEAAYKAIDPSKDNAAFPNQKVVGGIDLVGTDYDSASADYSKHIPRIDNNPLDEAGHGTHVAGTVAGRGDGINTYDGVAPDASLYAIKVFGAKGSTGDAAVIAGLEFAANPKGDMNLADKLDAVNLSLGSDYGSPHVMYTEAMQNLSRGGTVVVAAAGNSGDEAYVVGSPGVSDEAFSIAASVDNADQNWKFAASRINLPAGPLLVEAIEGTVGRPIKDVGAVSGKLVYAGLADKDFSADVAATLKGNIALIDRGVVAFADKVARAQAAGALGVVIVNNAPGAAIPMAGSEDPAAPLPLIPAIMIAQDVGQKVKDALAATPPAVVTFDFKTDSSIEKPELIDTIASFSSKGPRSLDALIKPEIAAPGQNIISAGRGLGNKGVQMSGTSMATPHMTGVMALMKQQYPTLSSAELKAVVMATATTLKDEKGVQYPVSRQGAGRVQIMKALSAKAFAQPSAMSLGEMTVGTSKMVRRSIAIKNISKDTLTLAIVFKGSPNLRMGAPSSVTITGGDTVNVDLTFTISSANLTDLSSEADGLITFSDGTGEIVRVPALAMINKVSQVTADALTVHSTSEADAQGAAADIQLANTGVNAGDAYLFNMLGQVARKPNPFHDSYLLNTCALEDVGYRVIQKNGQAVAQFAVKLYEPVSTWDMCEVSVLIDADGDGVIDQELVGTKISHLQGLSPASIGAPADMFVSYLLDSTAAQAIRKQFELDTVAQKPKIVEDYSSAVLDVNDMFAPQSSTVAIIEAPVSKLKVGLDGSLSVRIATSFQDSSGLEPDDFLNKDTKAWMKLSVSPNGAAYVGLPEKLSLAPGAAQSVNLTRGAGSEKLLVLFPSNKPVVDGLSADEQAKVMQPSFSVQ